MDRGYWTLIRVLLWWNEGEHTALSAWLVRRRLRQWRHALDQLWPWLEAQAKAKREREEESNGHP
jgi:hypothetical protein